MKTKIDIARRSNSEHRCAAEFGKPLTTNLFSREESPNIGGKPMFKLTPITNEEKPSVALTTDSFINQTYEIENESDYQKENAFVDTTIQNFLFEGNIHNTVVIECAGHKTTDPEEAGSWAFVALDENLDIIYEDYGTLDEFEGGYQEFNDYVAVIKALEWLLSLPDVIENIIVATDSEFVVEPCPLSCHCNDFVSTELKRELFELMSETGVTWISLIPKENNKAADLANRVLAESRSRVFGEVSEIENYA